MIQFNELRLSPDKNSLIIDMAVRNLSAYKNMYISSVHLEYYKNLNASGYPSNKAIEVYSHPESEGAEGIRRYRAVVPVARLSKETFGTDTFVNGLFYVFVACDGALSAEAMIDCGMDSARDMGIVLDWQSVYSRCMSDIRAYNSVCNPCDRSLDVIEHTIIIWNAIQLAVRSCDWTMLNKLWPRFIGAESAYTTECGCHK